MVDANADIAAGMEFGAALANKNHAADDILAAELLDAETTPGRIAAVSRRTACLFMGHNLSSGSGARRHAAKLRLYN
jgi:hypothetical protein